MGGARTRDLWITRGALFLVNPGVVTRGALFLVNPGVVFAVTIVNFHLK